MTTIKGQAAEMVVGKKEELVKTSLVPAAYIASWRDCGRDWSGLGPKWDDACDCIQ